MSVRARGGIAIAIASASSASVVVAAVATTSGCSGASQARRDSAPASSIATPPLAVRVRGGALVDGAGAPLRLAGVDRSGTEFACVQGNGIFDGPSDAAMIDAIVAWRANAVRLPMNEDCWLGINGVDPRYSGAAYQKALIDFVTLLHQRGLYAILDLHWTAPGSDKAIAQQPMADRDHAPDFWRSVARVFAADPAVIFDLFNEPFLDPSNAKGDPWSCWKSGCEVTTHGGYRSAGMQELVDAVRETGATQPLMLGGLAYANDLSGWLAHAPVDPRASLVASFHVYNFTTCRTAACWDGQVKPLLARVPVVTGEIGEDDCAHAFVDGYAAWADAAGISYLGWTWNTWGEPSETSCGSNKIVLIRDYAGNPTPFGAGYRAHLLARARERDGGAPPGESAR